jgi:hypothetical protein
MSDNFDNFDWTLLTSTLAIIMAKVYTMIDSESVISAISAVSALAFCLTAVLKFISYSMEEIPQIVDKWKKLKKESLKK